MPLGPLLTLGALLWIALLLQAFGVAWPAAAICLTAAATQAVLTTTELNPPMTQTLVCGSAAAVLLITAYVVLGRATAQR